MFKRNHSDGSASENSSETSDDYDDCYESEYRHMSSGDDECAAVPMSHSDDEDDTLIPRVYVSSQKKNVRFDRVTPKLLNLMNLEEKNEYINICKILYTEIYET